MTKRGPVVLLVDDEVGILSALGRSLRREGYQLLTADTVDRALRILEEQPVDAILSDHRMPGMSGLALLERAARLRPGAALMLLTGWPGSIPEEELAKLGIFALLTKPWDDAELKATLRRALAGK